MPFSNNPFPLFHIFNTIADGVENSEPDPGDANITILEAKRRYRWCQKWTEALARLRQDFNGDLDQYLLFLVFKQSEMAKTLSTFREMGHGDLCDPRQSRGLNAMSVAEICGIPRETARRKLKRLIERKIILMGPDGLYYLEKAGHETRSVDEMASLYAPSGGPSAAEYLTFPHDRALGGNRARSVNA